MWAKAHKTGWKHVFSRKNQSKMPPKRSKIVLIGGLTQFCERFRVLTCFGGIFDCFLCEKCVFTKFCEFLYTQHAGQRIEPETFYSDSFNSSDDVTSGWATSVHPLLEDQVLGPVQGQNDLRTAIRIRHIESIISNPSYRFENIV